MNGQLDGRNEHYTVSKTFLQTLISRTEGTILHWILLFRLLSFRRVLYYQWYIFIHALKVQSCCSSNLFHWHRPSSWFIQSCFWVECMLSTLDGTLPSSPSLSPFVYSVPVFNNRRSNSTNWFRKKNPIQSIQELPIGINSVDLLHPLYVHIFWIKQNAVEWTTAYFYTWSWYRIWLCIPIVHECITTIHRWIVLNVNNTQSNHWSIRFTEHRQEMQIVYTAVSDIL